MNLYENKLYNEDIRLVSEIDIPWKKLSGKSLLLSGATGLIGSFLIDVLMYKNSIDDLNCKVYALTRNENKAKNRFYCFSDNNNLLFIPYDVKLPFESNKLKKIDYVLHLASNTHPMQYSTDPIGTITTNVIGLINMLDLSVANNADRIVFASSNEIYGENRGDVELFEENYCGYINCNTVRAGYPESKRCGEALCQAYIAQKGLDIVIPRLTRTYGPTMLMTDTKAVSQFIKKGIAGEDIVLKSTGSQYYSYTYVADAVSGLLTVLLKGKCGEAYNISDKSGDVTLKNLASHIARLSGKKVIFEIPDSVESAGYSTATKARLDGKKLKSLGWKPQYTLEQGIERTMCILESLQKEPS